MSEKMKIEDAEDYLQKMYGVFYHPYVLLHDYTKDSEPVSIELAHLMEAYHQAKLKEALPSDEEIKRLIWEEWEGEIKEEDPRAMVFKYMIWLKQQLQNNER